MRAAIDTYGDGDTDVFDGDEELRSPEEIENALKLNVRRFWIACESCLYRDTSKLSKNAWSESCARSLYLLGCAIVKGGYVANAGAMQYKIGAAERPGWNAISLGIGVAQTHDVLSGLERLRQLLEADDGFDWCEIFKKPIPESFFEGNAKQSQSHERANGNSTAKPPVIEWNAISRWRELREQFRAIVSNPIPGVLGNTEWKAQRKRRLNDGNTRWELRDGWMRGDENQKQLEHVSMLAGDLVANCPPSDADDSVRSVRDAASRWWTYVGTVHNKFVPSDDAIEMLHCTDGHGNPHPIEVLEIPNILAESKRACDLIIARLENITNQKGFETSYDAIVAKEADKLRESERQRKQYVADVVTTIKGESRSTNEDITGGWKKPPVVAALPTSVETLSPLPSNDDDQIANCNPHSPPCSYRIEINSEFVTFYGFGESASLPKDPGVERLIAVLSRRKVSVMELVSIGSVTNDRKPESIDIVDADRLSESGTANHDRHEPILGYEPLGKLREKIKEMIAERDEAEKAGDAANAERLTAELSAALEKQKSDVQRAANAVQKTLKRTYGRLRDGRKGIQLAKHFEKKVERRRNEPYVVYEPDESNEKIEWILK